MRRDHIKAIVKHFDGLRYRHNIWQAWTDFVELAACAFSRADLRQAEQREKRYLEVIKRYSKEEAEIFPRILGELVLALEDEPADVLGAAFMELELGNKWTGQFFTPQCVSDVMAAMTFDDAMVKEIDRRGFVRMNEPAIGGGALVIAMCKAMLARKVNYQRHLHVTACDVDIKAVHMAYVQLSLLHVPAVIVHGNTLTLEERSHWYTPAHILGGWNFKLRAERPADQCGDRCFHNRTDGQSGPERRPPIHQREERGRISPRPRSKAGDQTAPGPRASLHSEEEAACSK